MSGTISDKPAAQPDAPAPAAEAQDETAKAAAKKPREHGGPSGLEPTRYGDWERKGICVDF